jgi:CubicO group peptidase (beta-lactamase class C family)
VASGAPVTADTVFRIASMSKNFTALAALKLRDAGKLRFDAPAENYLPELKALHYPTTDSPRITVRDLLTHTEGFVTDDPWGDRQLAMDEQAFTRLIMGGFSFARAPGMAHEYSNTGYALLGRIVSRVSGRYYPDYIAASFLKPLGMAATGYDYTRVPAAHRAVGYRWEDGAWLEEPVLGPGAYGAMGGLMTSANDYARYVAWVLSAWPPRDGREDPLLRRASVRELARSQAFTSTVAQPATGCPRVVSYSYGMRPTSDCVLGLYFTHSGGLPGYGSNVVFLPEHGMGVFAFANRTYAPAAAAVRDAATRLVQSQAFPRRELPPSAPLQAMAAQVARVYAAGDVLVAREQLAANVLLDHDAAHRNAQLATLKQKLGSCAPAAAIKASSALTAEFTYGCERGTLRASVDLAPTLQPLLQRLEFPE